MLILIIAKKRKIIAFFCNYFAFLHNLYYVCCVKKLDMKIGIVEDHKLLRLSYKMLLKDFDCVVEASNGIEMITQINELEKNKFPDVLIVDINMPEMDGFETVSWLKSNHPNIRIVIVTQFNDNRAILRMIKLGINSYLIKSELHTDEFIDAIKTVAKGKDYFTSNVTEAVINSYKNGSISEIESLNEREIEVLKLICEEKLSLEISDELQISPRTIEMTVKNMMTKLNVKSRIGLVIFAIKNNLFKI